jgi:hypothetical protein
MSLASSECPTSSKASVPSRPDCQPVCHLSSIIPCLHKIHLSFPCTVSCLDLTFHSTSAPPPFHGMRLEKNLDIPASSTRTSSPPGCYPSAYTLYQNSRTYLIHKLGNIVYFSIDQQPQIIPCVMCFQSFKGVWVRSFS